MKLVYFTHKKEDKNSGCHNIIGKEDSNVYHTIHIKSSQKEKKTVEFKPSFSGYEKGMVKMPLNDRYLCGQYLQFLNNNNNKKDEEK